MAVIVIVGIGLIVFSRGDTGSAGVPPQPGNPTTGEAGDHWHSAFAVNICGQWIDPPSEFETQPDNPNVNVGVHTHGDGFIHIHPFSRSEGGDNATLGRFLEYGGFGVSEDSINFGEDAARWPGVAADPEKREWSNGDECPPGTTMAGRTGVVKWSINCTDRSGNPADYKLKDLQVLALAFLPENEPIGVPPNASATPARDEQSTPSPLDVENCATAGPGGELPTPTAPLATTPTTLPPG
jgi:hypothetical protein